MVFTKSLRSLATRLASLGAIVVGIFVLVAAPSSISLARAAPPSEYELKAVFLLNFARFTNWPPQILSAPESPIIVGVVGTDPFGGFLETAFHDELIAGRHLEIRRFSRHEDYRNCHLLFISRSESVNLPEILTQLRGRHVLTVSDIDQFVFKDGMIGMLIEQGHVKVQVNYDQTRAEDLELSAKLLKLSFVIRGHLHSRLRTLIRALCYQEPTSSRVWSNKKITSRFAS